MEPRIIHSLIFCEGFHVILLDYVPSRALFYREGPPLTGLDAPKHIPIWFVPSEGDHGLVSGLGLVYQAMRINVVGVSISVSKDFDISFSEQQLSVNVNVLTHQEMSLGAAFLRLPVRVSGDWDDQLISYLDVRVCRYHQEQ